MSGRVRPCQGAKFGVQKVNDGRDICSRATSVGNVKNMLSVGNVKNMLSALRVKIILSDYHK